MHKFVLANRIQELSHVTSVLSHVTLSHVSTIVVTWKKVFFENERDGTQWRILRVFKVFSEHPDISKKYFFLTFYILFHFL